MALIVPPPGAGNPRGGQNRRLQRSECQGRQKRRGVKGSQKCKSTKGDRKIDDSDDSDDSGDSNKFGKVAQLSGKRVGIVSGNEATTGLLELVLSHYGVPLAKVTVSQIDPKNLADAVRNNHVDALFVAGAATGPGHFQRSGGGDGERQGADLHRDRSGRRHCQTQPGFRLDRYRRRHLRRQSADARRQPQESQLRANIWWHENRSAIPSSRRWRRSSTRHGRRSPPRCRATSRSRRPRPTRTPRSSSIPARWRICPTASSRFSTNTATIFSTAC